MEKLRQAVGPEPTPEIRRAFGLDGIRLSDRELRAIANEGVGTGEALRARLDAGLARVGEIRNNGRRRRLRRELLRQRARLEKALA